MEDFLFYKMDSTYMPVVKFTNKVSVKPPHIHIKRQTEEFILYFVLSGEMYLKEGSREYALKPGDMLILDPHLVHCGTKASSCTYFYIHFYHDRMAECSGPEELVKNELVSSRFAALQTDECTIRKNPASSILLPKHMHIGQPGAVMQLTELLEQIKASHYNHLEHFQLNTGCLFLQFLILLSRELTDSCLYEENSGLTGRSTRIIHDILTFFQSSYTEEITSALIEQKYGCNYDYINRLFKKATGKTILAYLNELRISKARQLLSDGTSRISDVAEKCGFRDIYYFSRVFKKYTGTTPGAYSRKYGLSGKKMPLARNISVPRE